MNTKFLLSGLFLIVANVAMADKLTEAQALAIAESFASNNAALSKSTVQGANTLTLVKASTGYYAFNRGNSNGFVLVAADDLAASSVLGYADSGSFSTENMPENLKWWLGEYDRQIEFAAANAATAKSKTRVATPVYADVAPMVTALWGQDSPYSNLCPTAYGYTCPTGCVATAMAQIMYYYKWPEQGTGSNSYTWTGAGNRRTLSVDFSKSQYDWDSMTDVYGSNSTEASEDAVAKLMYDAGVACNMEYDPNGSATYSYSATIALYKYFGYDRGMNIYTRNYYNHNEWIEMLYAELAAGRPIIYGAYTADNEGHAFVVDGYSDGYFHINWGWDGMSNGYFSITALNPYSQGTGGGSSAFSYDQDAIMGIKKAEDDSSFNPLFYCYDFYVTIGTNRTYNRSNRVSFSETFWYQGLEDVTVYFGLQVINSTGSDTVYVSSTNTTKISKPSSSGANGVTTIIVPMTNFPSTNGSYLVYPAFKTTDGDWQVIRSADTDHVIATLNGNTITFANPTEEESVLSASDIAATSSVYAGKTFTAKATLSNEGAEYYNTVNMVVLNADSKQQTKSDNVMVAIPEGSSSEVKFSLTAPSTPGSYILAVVDADGAIIETTTTLTVSSTPQGTLSFTVNNIEVENADNAIAADLNATLTVTCNDGVYTGMVVGFIFDSTSGNSIAYITSQEDVIIGSGETKTIELSGVFSDAVEGNSYLIRPGYYTGTGYSLMNNRSYTTFTIGAITGIDGVKADADSEVSDIEIYSLTGALVAKQKGSSADTSGLSPGVYLVKKNGKVRRIIKK